MSPPSRAFPMMMSRVSLICFLAVGAVLRAVDPPPPGPGDRMLAQYFREETARLSAQTLSDVKTLRDWTDHRAQYREELFEMVGLSPRPERTNLKATVTGREEESEFFVE